MTGWISTKEADLHEGNIYYSTSYVVKDFVNIVTNDPQTYEGKSDNFAYYESPPVLDVCTLFSRLGKLVIGRIMETELVNVTLCLSKISYLKTRYEIL